MKKFLCFIVFLKFFNIYALDIKDYNSMKDSKPRELCSYLSGLSSGYIWGDLMDLKSNEKSRKFCMDKKITLNCLNYIDILDKQIKLMKSTSFGAPLVSDDSIIEPQFYMALKDAYSCK